MNINQAKSFVVQRLPSSFQDAGVQALMVTSLCGNLVRLLSSLILARLLSPEAFAITGLAATVIFAFNMVTDGGFRAFILKHHDGGEAYLLKTLWTIKFCRNIILALLMFVSADAIAAYFAIADLTLVLKVLCLVFLVDGLIPIGFIAIERQNRIARVMYVRFASSLLTTVFMIVGVLYTRDIWPIIASMIMNNVFQIVLGYFFIGFHGTGFAINKSVFVEFMHWAKFIIPSSIITLVLLQFDKVMLGRTLSVSELGLYFIAFNFSSAAVTFTIEYSRGVLQPYFSIVYRENPEVYVVRKYQKKQFLSLLFAFGLGLLAGGSYLFFDVLYDDRYLSAGFYLSLLLVTPIMMLITYPSEVSLILHGFLKTTLVANITRLIWFFCGALGSYLWWGANGLLVTIMLVELFPAIYMLYRLRQLKLVRIRSELSIVLVAGIGFLSSRFLLSLFE
jgi:O-antigen/teichoic acid export membrane protein